MKNTKKIILIIVISIIIIGILLGSCYFFIFKGRNALAKVDDWEYGSNKRSKLSSMFDASSISSGGTTVYESASSKSSEDSYLGYTVGGASNIENFRKNIKNNYLPLTTDITYNGLYSEYYFDTARSNGKSDEMFYPTYSTAVSTDPFSGKREEYISVGLNSNIKESDFKRKKINLVFVIDISGSMQSAFNSYYYDKKLTDKSSNDNKSKMKIAEECVNNLIDKLNPDDRFGIVLFDDSAYLGKKISTVSDTDLGAIKNHLLEVEPQGGTNFSSGYKQGTELFNEYLNDDSYQNRIIVITDAMPNAGDTSSTGLIGMMKENAKKKIYTTLLGVGVDFNTKLIEEISDVEGTNYYSVHNSEEFNKVLVNEFDYMITPLIFNLNFNFISEGYEIVNIYGSDSANKETGNIMHINTLFPSASNSNGEVKGGIVVLKVRHKENCKNDDMALTVEYEDANGKKHSIKQEVSFFQMLEDYYDNTGIRKAIALARYVNVMKNWILSENDTEKKLINYSLEDGIPEMNYSEDYITNILGIHERKSTKLKVSDEYAQNKFKAMKNYMQKEYDELKDETLKQELEILDYLINYNK